MSIFTDAEAASLLDRRAAFVEQLRAEVRRKTPIVAGPANEVQSAECKVQSADVAYLE